MREVSVLRARVYSRDAVGYGCIAVHMRIYNLQRDRPAHPLRNFQRTSTLHYVTVRRFIHSAYFPLYIARIIGAVMVGK